MTTITFAAHELEELKKFYQTELDKATQRVEDIKSILNKFGATTETKSEFKPRGFAAIPIEKVKEIASLGGKSSHGGGRPSHTKRNRKTKTIPWKKFIPKLLKTENRYLNINDFTNAAIEKFKLYDKDKTYHILSVTLPRMTKMGVLQTSKKEGQTIKFYGLPSWTRKEPEISTKKIAPDGEIVETKENPVQNQNKINRRSKKIVIPWKKFIPQQIKENGSLTIYDFADAAMKKYHYPDREKLIRTLSPTLSRMLKIGKLTFDRKPGQKTHLYGLPSVPVKVKATNEKAVVIS